MQQLTSTLRLKILNFLNCFLDILHWNSLKFCDVRYGNKKILLIGFIFNSNRFKNITGQKGQIDYSSYSLNICEFFLYTTL